MISSAPTPLASRKASLPICKPPRLSVSPPVCAIRGVTCAPLPVRHCPLASLHLASPRINQPSHSSLLATAAPGAGGQLDGTDVFPAWAIAAMVLLCVCTLGLLVRAVQREPAPPPTLTCRRASSALLPLLVRLCVAWLEDGLARPCVPHLLGRSMQHLLCGTDLGV